MTKVQIRFHLQKPVGCGFRFFELLMVLVIAGKDGQRRGLVRIGFEGSMHGFEDLVPLADFHIGHCQIAVQASQVRGQLCQ